MNKTVTTTTGNTTTPVFLQELMSQPGMRCESGKFLVDIPTAMHLQRNDQYRPGDRLKSHGERECHRAREIQVAEVHQDSVICTTQAHPPHVSAVVLHLDSVPLTPGSRCCSGGR